MKNPALIFGRIWLILAVCLGVVSTSTTARAGQFKYEAQLIWATNDEKSPDEKHKAVEPEIRKKLEELPLKWKNLFEVQRTSFSVPKGESKKVCISDNCSIEVKIVDEGKKVEVTLCGKTGKVCSRQTQPLEAGEILVLGGNAPNQTAWLVTLKRLR